MLLSICVTVEANEDELGTNETQVLLSLQNIDKASAKIKEW